MRFFLDNNISPKVARALNHLLEPDYSAHHLKDQFAANTPDEVWMADLGRQSGWVILSGDSAISPKSARGESLEGSRPPNIFLKHAWTYLPGWESAVKTVTSSFEAKGW